MAAAGHSSTEREIVSPELVLIDPHLATDEQGLFSDTHDTLEQIEQESSLDSAERPLPVEGTIDPTASLDEDVSAARRRLTEHSERDEPTKRRSLRFLIVSRLRRRGAPSGL